MKTILLLSWIIFSTIATSCVAQTLDPWSSLNESQHAFLHEGKQVLVTEKIKDAPWPCFHIYRLVHGTPMEAAAVFWDAENAPNFIPHCVKVTVDARPAKDIAEICYELQIPIFSNEVSKVRNTLKSFPHEGGYEIFWDVLYSKYAKSGRGSFLAVPHEHETLICYTNFVDPGSIIAPLLRSHAEKQVQETVAAIVAQIEQEVQKNPEQLLKQEEQLKKALEK